MKQTLQLASCCVTGYIISCSFKNCYKRLNFRSHITKNEKSYTSKIDNGEDRNNVDLKNDTLSIFGNKSLDNGPKNPRGWVINVRLS